MAILPPLPDPVAARDGAPPSRHSSVRLTHEKLLPEERRGISALKPADETRWDFILRGGTRL
jgi:hypothetical protein